METWLGIKWAVAGRGSYGEGLIKAIAGARSALTSADQALDVDR